MLGDFLYIGANMADAAMAFHTSVASEIYWTSYDRIGGSALTMTSVVLKESL